MISAQAFNPAFYNERHLRHLRNLGPRRTGEIGLVLILAGLLAPPGDPPGPSAGPARLSFPVT